MKNLFKQKIKIFILKLYINLHNYSYKQISKWAKKIEGIHPKHRITNYHKFFVDNVNASDGILDIGHGNGALAHDIANKVKNILGIDLTHNYKNKSKKSNLNFIRGDAIKYQFDRTFDKIILSNVLEHIENRIDFLKKLHNISNIILIRVPMENRDWVTMYKKEMDLEYRLDKTHFIEYTLKTLQKELNQSGWKLISYQVNWGELWGILEKNNV